MSVQCLQGSRGGGGLRAGGGCGVKGRGMGAGLRAGGWVRG